MYQSIEPGKCHLYKSSYNHHSRTIMTMVAVMYLLLFITVHSECSLAAESSPSSLFYKWNNCSYEERSLDLNDGTNNSSRRIFINDNFVQFYDIPFGFGCKEIYFPENIISIPFGTAYKEERNTNLFSPVKRVGTFFDLCAKYSNVSCLETFCTNDDDNNNNGTTINYELFNYCQYCREGKDFLEFHRLIVDMDNYSESTRKSKCSSFTRFPSSFFCQDVQTGFPVYFMDSYFKRLRTPFLCYCHCRDSYSNSCDPVLNSLLRTDTVNTMKFIISLIISLPLIPFSLFGYVIPTLVSMIRRRKFQTLNALCALIIFLQSICVEIACILFWNPTYDNFDTLYFTTSIALSLNVFFTHYGSLTVLLVFDRISQFLKGGENRNSLIALILTGISFCTISVCAIYIVSYLIVELEAMQQNIELTGISYVAYALPWIFNFLIFIYIAKTLGNQLKEKTNLSFYKSKYMFQFSLYCILSLFALVACICNFLGRQFGTNAYFFIGSFYLEIVSNFANISTFVVINIIIFDRSKFFECYDCIIEPVRNLRRKIKEGTAAANDDDYGYTSAPLIYSGSNTAQSSSTSTETTTNPSDQNHESDIYPSKNQSREESTNVSL